MNGQSWLYDRMYLSPRIEIVLSKFCYVLPESRTWPNKPCLNGRGHLGTIGNTKHLKSQNIFRFFKAGPPASEDRGDPVVMWTLDIRQDTDSQ